MNCQLSIRHAIKSLLVRPAKIDKCGSCCKSAETNSCTSAVEYLLGQLVSHMSVAASHARKFYEQVVAEQRVFTFVENGSYLVFKIGGAEVIPFWSHRSRLDEVQQVDPKFLGYQPDEISLDEFLAKTLPQLDKEDIRVGVNWSGSRLTGYDLTVDELKRHLDYWMAKRSG